jgi:BirA family biotin operon repressor/biotin-[acetyl-CoA-carboxylase] ligase
MAKTDVLKLLADGEFHSGQELANALGVSRTAIWKQLGKLEESGLTYESVKGKGYRLSGGIDLLDEQQIRAGLEPAAEQLLNELLLADAIDSTNAEILRQLESGKLVSGLVCSAEQQTAGRGRRGRQWISPYAGNIYLSLGWEFAGGAAALEGLSLAVGVAVSEALAGLGVGDVVLKWPNDLLHTEAKLGGVLIEMVGDAAGPCAVVVGIGINVRMSAVAARDIDQKWTDLSTVSAGQCASRSQLLAALLNQLLPLLSQYEELGFQHWRERWLALDAHADQPVVITSGSRKMSGTARGIDASGALLLETELGISPVHGGEVSLRKA